MDEPLRGPLFETYAAQNIASVLEAGWPGGRLHYWHVQGRHEVDFVGEAGRHTLALEMKAASRWTDRDLAGLRAFVSATPRCLAGIPVRMGSEAVRLGERLYALPLARVLA